MPPTVSFLRRCSNYFGNLRRSGPSKFPEKRAVMTHSGCRKDLLPHRVPAAQRRDCGHSGGFESPPGFARSVDSTTSGSGHHHPARYPIFEREPGKPSIKSAHPLAAGGIAAGAKNGSLGQVLPFFPLCCNFCFRRTRTPAHNATYTLAAQYRRHQYVTLAAHTGEIHRSHWQGDRRCGHGRGA